jgi:hypothetical protein
MLHEITSCATADSLDTNYTKETTIRSKTQGMQLYMKN